LSSGAVVAARAVDRPGVGASRGCEDQGSQSRTGYDPKAGVTS